MLSLTGPSRGLLLHRNVHFEINLKSKSCRAVDDIEIAKSYLKDEVATSISQVVRNRLVGRLCTIDLTYAPILQAVEGTVEVQVDEILRTRERPDGSTAWDWLPFNKKRKEHSEFHGKITVSIAGIPEDVILYDSEADGTVITVSNDGFVELSRRVVAVPIDWQVWLKVAARGGDSVSLVYPNTCGSDSVRASPGSYRLCGTFTWSGLYSPKVDGVPSSYFPPLECFAEAMKP